jgi:hypothetical protein
MRHDADWFRAKVRTIGDALARLPRARQLALFDTLDAERERQKPSARDTARSDNPRGVD